MFASARNTPATSTHLVEFKAGRCKLEAGSAQTKRKVVAETDRGLLFIKQSNDQLMHFCWKNRDSGALVDDLIIFPGDTEFKEVKGCPDGQIFMLKFLSSEDKRLFWVQEPNLDKDIVQKVNDALNKPPPSRPSHNRERNTTGGGLASLSNTEDLGTLGGLDQSQLMQLLQFMSPGNASSGGESPSTLSNLLAMGANRDGSPSQAAGLSTPTQPARPPNDLFAGETEPRNVSEAAPRAESPIDPTNTSNATDAAKTSSPINPVNTSSSGESTASVKEPEPKRGKPDDEMELD